MCAFGFCGIAFVSDDSIVGVDFAFSRPAQAASRQELVKSVEFDIVICWVSIGRSHLFKH